MSSLPKFTEHGANRKNERLDSIAYGRPDAVIADFLSEYRGGKSQSDVSILDVGCGRGARVSWLCQQGWDAWGVDVARRYLESGRPFFEDQGWGAQRLALVGAGTDGLPFEDARFDIVLSDQVIEHVADLDRFVSGIARVTKPGGVGMHVFPATLRPVEPHLRHPLVHWVPKGRLRHTAIAAAVRARLGVQHFAELGCATQARIYSDFSNTETYYRFRRTVAHSFANHGLAPDLRDASRRKTQNKLGERLPSELLPIASLAYSLFLQTYLTTAKRAPA